MANSIAYQRLAQSKFSADIERELKGLAVMDNWHSLWAVACGCLIVAAAVVAGESSPWLYPLAVMLIGARQRALTTLLHDAAHGRAARSRWLNRLVGTYLSGYLVFQAFTPYRRSHVVFHHGHLGDPEHDPDLQFYIAEGLYSGMTPRRFLWRQVFASVLMLNAPLYLWYVVKHRLIALWQTPREALGMAALWGILMATVGALDGWRLLLLYWVVPYVTSFLIIGRFIEIAEHYPMLGANPARTILHGTRNRFSHPIEAIFFSMLNENYHLVHHLRPDIPFRNLDKAHVSMLKDPEYRRLNQQFGGIFVSRDPTPALIPALVSGKLVLPDSFADERLKPQQQ